MNFSDNLKKIRKEHNLSQEQIAESLGVSRQSVSKWESGLAYPEMDKMLSLCKMFNLNIDELLNQDIKEVNNTKQAKININKYIDDFLDYITKTINMFSSMKLKQKIKCLIEQVIIIGILSIILLILGSILSSIFNSLFSFIPNNIYFPIFHIFKALYLIFCLILSISLIFHIFKVRYLDYYIIVKENTINKEHILINESSITNEIPKSKDEKSPQEILLENNLEKIIIRDPKHTGYKFINSLLKCLLFFIKTVSLIPGFFLCMSLIFLVICLILSFLFIKTGLLFMGTILMLISLIIINLNLIFIIYNFIISKKNKKTSLITSIIISLILLGTGIGLFTIDILKFNIITDIDSKHYIKEEYTFDMTDNLYFEDYYSEIEYIESPNNDIKVEIVKPPLFIIDMQKHSNNGYYFDHYIEEEKILEILNLIIEDINSKEFVDYSNYKITIYTTKENIQKLNDNLINYYKEQNEISHQNTINEYERRINELENRICILEDNC